MKKSFISLFASCAIALVVVGCGPGEIKLDSTDMKAEFGSASGDVKADADRAIAAIDGKRLTDATVALSQLIARSNDLSQAQITAAEEAFVAANVMMFERGDRSSAAEAKGKTAEEASSTK